MTEQTQKLTGNELENMTWEQILEMDASNIEKFKPYEAYPEGLVSGVILEWKEPTEKSDAFIVEIALTNYIEFAKAEDQQNFQLREGAKVTQRYSRKGAQALVTDWAEVLAAFDNKIGLMMFSTKGMPIVFQMTQRKDKEKKNDQGQPITYNGLSKIRLA